MNMVLRRHVEWSGRRKKRKLKHSKVKPDVDEFTAHERCTSFRSECPAPAAAELVRLNVATQRIDAPVRGGLAGWQQRIVTAYVEEHLAEHIPLATLARLVRLSPYYFCWAFKQSFGLPPHRYHNKRRIEEAKMLLAKPAPSVTDIGLTLGYRETSSFTTAFRRAIGLTTTAYHRSLT
jgi:AraC family transcriptional regulator